MKRDRTNPFKMWGLFDKFVKLSLCSEKALVELKYGLSHV